MKYLQILILFFCFFKAKADYSYMSLSNLVCKSEYGAIGTIIDFDKNYFYLKVEKYVLNEMEFDTLKIQRFYDWTCAKRYEEYKIGQQEFVFFNKSNNLIEEYDLIYCGFGGEFELQIKENSIFYSYGYNKQKEYSLNDFLIALSDFNEVKIKLKNSNKLLSNDELYQYSKRSELHNIFFNCKIEDKKYQNIDFSKNSIIVDLEKNFLYKKYENKIHVFGHNNDSINLVVEDAEYWREKDFYIIKPYDSAYRCIVKVFSLNDKTKYKPLVAKVFQTIDLPEPKVHFGYSYGKNISIFENQPRVSHFLDENHTDKNLIYELLSYTYTIKSEGKIYVYKIKSSRLIPELNQYQSNFRFKEGDEIIISDIKVRYPNNEVKIIKDETFIVSE
jgi:hypothetical protein